MCVRRGLRARWSTGTASTWTAGGRSTSVLLVALNEITPAVRDPGKLQQMIANIDSARRALAGLKDVITSVGQDIDGVLFEPLRSMALAVKDLMGVPITLVDLPVNIVRDMKGAILEVMASVRLAQILPPPSAASARTSAPSWWTAKNADH
jgi:hypothetical protein